MYRLSWGLLYAALVTVMSFLMAVIATWTPLFSNSNFIIIFLLIFLYGISTVSPNRSAAALLRSRIIIFTRALKSSQVSQVPPCLYFQIFFSFMLTPLFKKPKFASTMGSMLTLVFGSMSLFTVLMRDFPQPAVWVLCLLSPSAFSIGIAQVISRVPSVFK